MPNPRILDPNKPLTPRERGYIKNRVKGKPIGKSALASGYAHEKYGSFLESQEKIQTGIQKALEKAKLTDDFLAKRLKEGCKATIPERRTKDGLVLVPKHPDHFNRPRYLDMAFKLKKGYLPEGAHEEKHLTVIQINLTDNRLKGLFESGMISKKEFEELSKERQEIVEAEVIKEEGRSDL